MKVRRATLLLVSLTLPLAACFGDELEGENGGGLGGPSPGARFVDNRDGTATDTQTELVWEIKTDDGGTHDVDDLYTWSEPVSEENRFDCGDPCVPDGTAFTAFLRTLNGGATGFGSCVSEGGSPSEIVGGFAGHCDWRLPQIDELRTLYDCSHGEPCIDPALGPTLTTSSYQSATTNVRNPDVGNAGRLGHRFTPSLGAGFALKTGAAAVRAVRGGIRRGCRLGTSGCDVRFVDNGDGTVTDNRTGLVWEKKTDDGTIHDKDNTYTWSSCPGCVESDGTAMTELLETLNGGAAGVGNCRAFEDQRDDQGRFIGAGDEVVGGFAGHCDWRLPQWDELQTLLVCGEGSGCADPALGLVEPELYWSATTKAGDPEAAFVVDLEDGNPFLLLNKDLPARVLAVRGGADF